MSAEEELQAYREELKEKEKQDLRRARFTAVKFGVLAVAAQITFVFAFFQQTQANKERVFAEAMVNEATSDRKKSEIQLKLCQEEFGVFAKSLESCRTK